VSAANIEELVVISGKGGTGKTSLTASFAVLAGNAVLADCDVDAADLHLLLAPRVKERHEFRSGNEAAIRMEECAGCGICREDCRFDAIFTKRSANGRPIFAVDPLSCEGCGVCVRFCPVGAIDFPERVCGEWMVSETRCGPMVHARLGLAAENSGKLVAVVRREAQRLAEETGSGLIITDGPPGIGCPVISSLTGATRALVVTEPTVSGGHDLERVLVLTGHFSIPAAVCVNKWDINPEMTERIEEIALKAGSRPVVVETDAPSAEDIRKVWDNLGLLRDLPIKGSVVNPGHDGVEAFDAKKPARKKQGEKSS